MVLPLQVGRGHLVGVDRITYWQADVAKPISALAISTYYQSSGDWQFMNYDSKYT